MPTRPNALASLRNRVKALRMRHGELQERIDSELNRPAPDSAILGRLKRRKLLIKDELQRYDGVLSSLGRRLGSNASGGKAA